MYVTPECLDLVKLSFAALIIHSHYIITDNDIYFSHNIEFIPKNKYNIRFMEDIKKIFKILCWISDLMHELLNEQICTSISDTVLSQLLHTQVKALL